MSSQAAPRLTRALGHLALALLNATLILIVLALFFAWRLAGTVERVAETAIDAASTHVAELTSVQTKLADVKTQLAALEQKDGSALQEAAGPVLAHLNEIGAQLSALRANMGSSLEAVAADPGILIDRAVTAGVAEFGEVATSFASCTAADARGSLRAEPALSTQGQD